MAVVLVVDDEPSILELVEDVIGEEHEVVTASAGEEALELMKTSKPDLVILDLMMPKMDGWQIHRHMKADPALASIPVLVLTARAGQAEIDMAYKLAGVDDYIVKPFDPEDLRGRVVAILA